MTLPDELRERGAAGWWLERLDKELVARAAKLAEYDAYYRGDHKLAFASEKFRQAFGGLFRTFADNWCSLVVEAVEDRLNVEGFRLGEEREGDRDAWEIWQRNQLDAESQIAHTEALIHGEAYALVWPGDDGPDITVEHPNQVIVAYAAGARRERLAALKKWRDDDGLVKANVYLRDAIYKFQTSSKQTGTESGTDTTTSVAAWTVREVDGEQWPLPNPLGEVPVVALRNRPRLLGPCESEIARVIPIQNAVNKTVADMLVASEYGAFRQRYAIGLELDEDEETGEKKEPFRAAIDRLWVAEDKDARFGEFSQTDLQTFVQAIEMLVQHIASQTRTPPHYFYLRGQFPSGESIKSAETGLVRKTIRKTRHFGEAWEDVMRMAFLASGDEAKARAAVRAETIWADPETRSESELMDSLVKMQALGVPNDALWARAGASPTEIARWRAQGADPAPQPTKEDGPDG
ncbi:MAG TPA: phage portal protein [Candidatus Limnocylindria bacterium]|nr:phage portal protein [Candidatus Limnocylindria bacterium]